MSSRWTDTPEDLAVAARLKAEKAARKALKESRKQRAVSSPPPPPDSKRVKTTLEPAPSSVKLLRFKAAEITACRNVDASYERLNHIEEGSYGVVSRARDRRTGEIVALKKLKLERETDGFPITSLREVATLMAVKGHEGVVGLREVVVGDSSKEFVPSPFPRGESLADAVEVFS